MVFRLPWFSLNFWKFSYLKRCFKKSPLLRGTKPNSYWTVKLRSDQSTPRLFLPQVLQQYQLLPYYWLPSISLVSPVPLPSPLLLFPVILLSPSSLTGSGRVFPGSGILTKIQCGIRENLDGIWELTVPGKQDSLKWFGMRDSPKWCGMWYSLKWFGMRDSCEKGAGMRDHDSLSRPYAYCGCFLVSKQPWGSSVCWSTWCFTWEGDNQCWSNRDWPQGSAELFYGSCSLLMTKNKC